MTDTQQAKSDREALLARRLEQAEARVVELEAELSLIYASEGAAPGPSGPSCDCGAVSQETCMCADREAYGRHIDSLNRMTDKDIGAARREPLPIVSVPSPAENERERGEPVAFVSKTGEVSIIEGGALPDLVRNMPDPLVGKAVSPLYAHPDPAVERLTRELRLLREQQKEDFDRATAAEASLAKAREALRQIAEHKERDEGVNGDNCRWSYSIGWAFHNCQSIARAALKERTDG